MQTLSLKIRNFYQKNKPVKVAATVAVVIALVIGGIFGMSMLQTKPFEASLFVELNAKAVKDKKEVKTDIILNGDVEMVDGATQAATVSLALNAPVQVSQNLLVGTYALHMMSTPIEADGSTYKIPSGTVDVVVDKEQRIETPVVEVTSTNSTSNNTSTSNNVKSATYSQKDGEVVDNTKRIDVAVTLEKLPVKNMTKEQLTAVIKRIETETEKPATYKPLVEKLEKQKEKAPSKPESDKEIVQLPIGKPIPQPTEETTKPVEESTKPNEETTKPNEQTPPTGGVTVPPAGGGGGTTPPSTGGTTPPSTGGTKPPTGGGTTPPAPEKPKPEPEKPKPPVCTPNYVHHPAKPAEGYWEYHEAVIEVLEGYRTGDGYFFSADDIYALEQHSALNNTNYWYVYEETVISEAWSEWIETSPAQPAWDEYVGETCV